MTDPTRDVALSFRALPPAVPPPGARHPLVMADDLRALADRYTAAMPFLRRQARQAVRQLQAARRGAAECRRWARELADRYDQRRRRRPRRRRAAVAEAAEAPQQADADPVVLQAAEHLQRATAEAPPTLPADAEFDEFDDAR